MMLDFALNLVQDLQTLVQTTRQIQTRAELAAFELPQSTVDHLQSVNKTLSTTQKTQLDQQRSQFQQRRDVIQLGFQQRQQLIEQTVIGDRKN